MYKIKKIDKNRKKLQKLLASLAKKIQNFLYKKFGYQETFGQVIFKVQIQRKEWQ